ncbi:uncharacterized protein LOC111330618 isoform X2 [Stylophora pistillata]|uniref:Uncharacterized protein n=2 Tax=Stylophora pistillata TaxID=50429 RepID=A0A2B4S8X3_STYPI|nr:uncharacterized protein LOC111330618 isoform X2 [Stylophora pistillata]XP_022791243.1 uncharacterized protein LOC111330618 isoform X2 [Stylophora pistillata]XP_022791244.1 uncharacterized protein LOC111330618 isoform X2 [Stylophora pistillata]XP_022791245.1 uncharacterized protein LOC111330618 isoform X2 [Stylophora pistillata]XP_022791246.1 uncharacterized protein LOC111330618 isoform X2 [Stylophora pistillata]PFX25250.1 hypothetical protein AWC38_SpisGene10103 [Stylophora pistillata]
MTDVYGHSRCIQRSYQMLSTQETNRSPRHAQSGVGYARGIPQHVARMHLPNLSSTGGLACGSSPFNDDLLPLTNSSIHSHCIQPRPLRPCFRSALTDTNWPVVQPVFVPVDTSQIRVQTGCHQRPSPCHASVCSCWDHLSPCGCSASAKRPRLEGGRQLIPIETGIPSHVTNARAQNSPGQKELSVKSSQTRRPPDSPPPLVKISPTVIHQKTSEARSMPETRRALHSRSPSVIASRNVKPVQRHVSLKDRNGCPGTHSPVLRDSSSTLCTIGPLSSPTKNSTLSKFNTDSPHGPKSNTTCGKFEDEEIGCMQCHTSVHHENPKDEFLPSHQTKIKYSEIRDLCTESKMRSNETVRHFLFTEAGDDILHFNRARHGELQQNHKKKSLAKYRGRLFVACECAQTYQPHHFDGNLERKHHPSVDHCCKQPVERIPMKATWRKSVIRHHQTTNSKSSGQKVEPQVNKTRNCNCDESSNPKNQEFNDHPDAEFFKQSKRVQKFATKAGNKIARFYPISRVESHQKFEDASNKSEASYSRFPESNIPQLRRGRPRTRGIKDKTRIYDGSLTFGPTKSQSRQSVIMPGDVPKFNGNVEDPNDEVFYEQSCADMNNNETVALDNSRYRSAVSDNHSTTNTRPFVNGHQMRRKFTVSGHTKLEMHVREPLDVNTDARLTSSRDYSNDHGLLQRGSPTHYHEASRDNCQKSLFVLNDQTPNVSVSRRGQKRSPSTPCYNSSRFVTSLNDLLKRRTKSAEELYPTKSFPFGGKQRQDDLQFENNPNEVQNSHRKEQIKEVTKEKSRWDSKAPEKNRNAENFDCSVDQREIMEFGKNGPKQETRQSATFRLSTTKREQAKCHAFKTKATNSQENKISIVVGKKGSKCQSPMSQAVPPPSAEEEPEGMRDSCGGYAIDHSFLPKIVAVHSIANRDDTPGKDDPKIFSENSKKYWNDLLKKLTSEICNDYEDTQSLKDPIQRNPASSHTIGSSSLREESKIDDSRFEPSPKDGNVAFLYNVESSSLCGVKMNNGSPPCDMNYCHVSSSQNMTSEVPSPLPIVESEGKKTPLPRKKQTVAELSQKILTTRDRIKQETIAWKKKLLYSLEAIFIKKLRKIEKETGEKAEIPFEETVTKEESKEKKNGSKERRQSNGEREKVAVPRHK